MKFVLRKWHLILYIIKKYEMPVKTVGKINREETRDQIKEVTHEFYGKSGI